MFILFFVFPGYFKKYIEFAMLSSQNYQLDPIFHD